MPAFDLSGVLVPLGTLPARETDDAPYLGAALFSADPPAFADANVEGVIAKY